MASTQYEATWTQVKARPNINTELYYRKPKRENLGISASKVQKQKMEVLQVARNKSGKQQETSSQRTNFSTDTHSNVTKNSQRQLPNTHAE